MRKTASLLLSVLICALLVVNVFGAYDLNTSFTPVERTLPLVVDSADLLTDQEEIMLNEKLENFADKYKSEIAIVTVNDLGYKSPGTYADDFYDYNGYGYGENDDGMLVLYKPGPVGERDIYISTHGTGIYDYDADVIIDAMIDDLKAEDYTGAFNTYIKMAEKAHKFSVDPTWIIVSIALGMVIGLAVPWIMARGNKSVKAQRDASVYIRNDSMVLTVNRDVLANVSITKTPIPKNTTSSVSTHTGSSGRSHGGGGRRF